MGYNTEVLKSMVLHTSTSSTIIWSLSRLRMEKIQLLKNRINTTSDEQPHMTFYTVLLFISQKESQN